MHLIMINFQSQFSLTLLFLTPPISRPPSNSSFYSHSDRPDQINSREIIVTQLSLFDTHITWNMPDDNLNEIDGYNISYSDVRGLVLPTSIDSVTTSVDIDNLGINTNYSLSISATNGVGVSEGSSPIIFSGVTSGKHMYM